MIESLEPSSYIRPPTSSVIEGADAEQPRNGKPVDGEHRSVLEPGEKHERDAQAERDDERAEMKQSP